MDDGVVSKRSRRDGSLSLPSVLVMLWIFRRLKRRGDPDRPEIVSQSPQSKAVLERARELAGEGREDAGAVAELRALARRRRRTLRQAETASRFLGYHHERRQASLTNRLLQAAAAGEQTPTALTAAEEQRIGAIEAFKGLPRSEQWAFLLDAEPVLRILEKDARGGRFGNVTRPPDGLLRRGTRTHEIVDGQRMVKVTLSSSDPPPTADETRLVEELANARTLLTGKLESHIGPRSNQRDPVLASQEALDTARRQLTEPPGKERANAEAPL
jgi:hypothetical protein